MQLGSQSTNMCVSTPVGAADLQGAFIFLELVLQAVRAEACGQTVLVVSSL